MTLAEAINRGKSVLYGIGLFIFQTFFTPGLVFYVFFKWFIRTGQFLFSTIFHIFVYINSPLRMFRLVRTTFYQEDESKNIGSSVDSSEFSFELPVPVLLQICNKLNISELVLLLTQARNDIFHLPLYTHYLFDRYVVHSPYCVLKKFTSVPKISYSFRGIQLTKFDGFQDYLRLKNIKTQSKSPVPKLPLRRNNPKRIFHSPAEINPNKYVKSSRSPSANISKLYQASTQVTKILEEDPNLNIVGNLSKSSFRRREPDEDYPRGTLSQKLHDKLLNLPKEGAVPAFKPKRKLSDSSSYNNSLASVSPRGKLFKPNFDGPFIEPLPPKSPSPPPVLIDQHPIPVRKWANFSTSWNKTSHSSGKAIKIPISNRFDSSQVIGKSKQNVRYINIELPDKIKTRLKLTIVPKTLNNSKLENIPNDSGNIITESISPNETEYIEEIKSAIAKTFKQPGYDDGSLAPIILRLAWHCCATYDKYTGIGGSNGATMRFLPEIIDEGNTGLDIARSALEPIKQKFPFITYSDLWTLAGKVAIEQMGGPIIPWQCGRVDCTNSKYVPENGKLPFGDKDAKHIRTTFSRMGFSDGETVALLGGHGIGRCHKRFSGWEGKWTRNPLKFSNEFFKALIEEEWTLGTVPETGKRQFFNRDGSLMMLNTDMELKNDPSYYKFVVLYSRNSEIFEKDFAQAFGKLLELGIQRDITGAVLPKEKYL